MLEDVTNTKPHLIRFRYRKLSRSAFVVRYISITVYRWKDPWNEPDVCELVMSARKFVVNRLNKDPIWHQQINVSPSFLSFRCWIRVQEKANGGTRNKLETSRTTTCGKCEKGTSVYLVRTILIVWS